MGGRFWLKAQSVGSVHHVVCSGVAVDNLAGNFHALKSARLGIEEQQLGGALLFSLERIERWHFIDRDGGVAELDPAFDIHLVRGPITVREQTAAGANERIFQRGQRSMLVAGQFDV